ncbi:hypothetical protein CYMTET_27031, partial [Cymbomonas tetramitiformis]
CVYTGLQSALPSGCFYSSTLVFQGLCVHRAAVCPPLRLVSRLYPCLPRYGATAEGFLAYVKEQTAAVERCFEEYSVHQCAVNFESLDKTNEEVYYHADQIFKSLYAAYLPTWHAAFGRQRLLVLRSEDYWDNPRSAIAHAYEFLGFDELPDASWQAVLDRPISRMTGSEFEGACGTCGDFKLVNKHRPTGRVSGHTETRTHFDMLPEARNLLNAFYAPFNKQLASLLQDDRFLWEDSEMKVL